NRPAILLRNIPTGLGTRLHSVHEPNHWRSAQCLLKGHSEKYLQRHMLSDLLESGHGWARPRSRRRTTTKSKKKKTSSSPSSRLVYDLWLAFRAAGFCWDELSA